MVWKPQFDFDWQAKLAEANLISLGLPNIVAGLDEGITVP